MLCMFLKISQLNSLQAVPTETVPPDLSTIGVVLSAVGILLGIVSIALSIWQIWQIIRDRKP